MGGQTKSAHVRYLRSRGIDPGADLDLPELIPEALPTWEAFWMLHTRRAPGVPLSFSEIEAYTRITGEPLDPWQVRAICKLDDEWQQFYANEVAEAQRRQTAQSRR